MNSLILQTTTRFLASLILLYSVFLLIRGHNFPGGGFAGGLVASSGWALYTIAFGPERVRRGLRINSRSIVSLGLLLSILSGLIGLLEGENFLTGKWLDVSLPNDRVVTLGSPLLFDFGVYLVVLGTVLTIILALEEET